MFSILAWDSTISIKTTPVTVVTNVAWSHYFESLLMQSCDQTSLLTLYDLVFECFQNSVIVLRIQYWKLATRNCSVTNISILWRKNFTSYVINVDL